MQLTIIIGKHSNLSQKIYSFNDKFILISSREISNDLDVLSQYKDEVVNIIFNNFQTATQLNNLKNINEYITNTISVTARVLDYFKNTKINKIIYTSSSSVYGNNILCKETDEVKPMNLHASLKLSNEKLIERYCSDNNIDYTITRIFNMYGGDDNFSVVSKIINAYKSNEKLTIVNKGNAIRDFIYIDDVVSIYIKLLDKKDVKVLNIGTGCGNSIKGILHFLSYHDVKIKIKNIYKDELKISTSDVRLLNEVIGKYNFINIEDYLKKEFRL